MIARVGSAKSRFEDACRKAGVPDLVPSGAPINDLQLPHGAKLYTTGIDLPKDLDVNQWKEVGTKLMKINRSMQWAIGEWWRFGYHKYGDRKAFAEAGVIRYKFESLMNIGTVVCKVPTSSRNEGVDFTHHVVVAKFEPDQQKRYLAKAAKHEWSVKKLQEYIHDQEQTRHAMNLRGLEQDDPVEYRKSESRGWGDDFIEIAQKSKPRGMSGRSLFRQPDDPLLADLPDDLIKKMIEAASSVADMWTEIADALVQHRNARTKPQAIDGTTDAEEADQTRAAGKTKRSIPRERYPERLPQYAAQ